MKNNIKKELIIALKYICPKFGYGFLGLGVALLLTQPGKMADILFSTGGIGLLGFTLGGILFYVIGDLWGNYRYTKKVERLELQNQKLREIIASGDNKQQHKVHVPDKVVSPTESSSTQPRKPFDFDAEHEGNSMGDEPEEEVADEQIPEPAEEENTDLQESPES